jgi:hypothetical protein
MNWTTKLPEKQITAPSIKWEDETGKIHPDIISFYDCPRLGFVNTKELGDILYDHVEDQDTIRGEIKIYSMLYFCYKISPEDREQLIRSSCKTLNSVTKLLEKLGEIRKREPDAYFIW